MTVHQRKPLPTRRHTKNRKVMIPRDQTIHLSVGYHPEDTARPREVFYSAGLKSGSDLEYHMQDVCFLISLLLQHGLSPLEIGHSLSRRETENVAVNFGSLVGLVLDEVRKPPLWAAEKEESQ
ncbi:hypothetical protein [Ruegeria jejuensis]|uniref:hypothetical protein n=1 Tax=Ruegeria jejuensis TaxID=3233338 RepID=UPI00355C975E